MDISAYLTEIRDLYRTDRTTEHSFRPALERLFKSIDPTLTVINEPRRIVDVGAVDFVIQRGDVAIGWCEAKDIGKDIKKFAPNDYSKAQKERYLKAFPNLIYTNGLDFEFIRDGAMIDFVTIADLIPTLPARPDSFATLRLRLEEFAQATPLSVTSSKRLAEMMAARAGLIKDIMGNALVADLKAKDEGDPPTDLIGQYEAFKANLIHEITVAEFADIYAETIAYGLFAARLHDETQDTFSRAEALELLPKSNPFLRELFIYIAGPNLDERLRRTVDDLCAVFLATDMPVVLRHFGKVTRQQDPFLHFYEVFLAEYNPAKRKARGVWYTPEPVVNFIVRAVDEVLKTEFGLPDGLADTSRIAIDWDTGQTGKDGKPATIRKEVHRVQILDPATGTGTFLAEVVKLVAERVKGIAPGQWSQYVERDLIPRIHGFELLMASYAMCHMKLDMILTGLGYKPSGNPPRLGVYTQRIALSYTVPNYGGKRWWMHCPSTGARVAKLYMPEGGETFASRKAWRLGYQLQRVSPRDAVFERLFRLQRRLGSEQGWGNGITRPKGMHHRTFERHCERYWQIDEQCALLEMTMLARIAGRFGFGI